MEPSPAFTVWFTGLPSSGKSTLAVRLAERLRARDHNVEVIHSGKMRRTPLGARLGFSRDDRDTNVRRHAFAAHLLARNGVIGIVDAVSPYAATRDEIRRELVDFVEVYVSTPRAECIERDTRGNWSRALNGEIRNFTGVDDPYEPPTAAEVEVDLSRETEDAGVNRIVATLERLGRIDPVPADEQPAPLESKLQDL